MCAWPREVMLVTGAQRDGSLLAPEELTKPWSTSLAVLMEADVARQPTEATRREGLPLGARGNMHPMPIVNDVHDLHCQGPSWPR